MAHLELSLQVPQLFLSLGRLPVSMTQLDLHFVEVSLHLLFHSQGFVPASDLGIQITLHRVNVTLAVSLQLFDLSVLLGYLLVHFRFYLVQL